MRWVGVAFLVGALVVAGWQFTAGRRAWRADCAEVVKQFETRRTDARANWRAEEVRLRAEQVELTTERERRAAAEAVLAQRKDEVAAAKRKLDTAGSSGGAATPRPPADPAELARIRGEVESLRAETAALERQMAVMPGMPATAGPTTTATPGPVPMPATAPGVFTPTPNDPMAVPNWPYSHLRLLFAWESKTGANQVISPGGLITRTCSLTARGDATYSAAGALQLGRGAFVGDRFAAVAFMSVGFRSELSIEAVLNPANLVQAGPARIISLSNNANQRNFTLAQSKDKLVFRLRTTDNDENGTKPEMTIGALVAQKRQHVIVSYLPGKLSAWLDGKLVCESQQLSGELRQWTPMNLVFGDEWDGGFPWTGELDHVAIFSRFIGPEEAKTRYAKHAKPASP